MTSSGGTPYSDLRDDDALVRALNDGDPSGFDALYLKYRDWVYRLAWRFTGRPEDAMDVLQETFIYLLGRFPGFHLSARLTTFLYPVVKHLSLDLLRKRGRATAQLESIAAQAGAGAGCPAGRAELAQAISCLSPGHSEVVLMRFVDDMELAEIARALGLPLGTVKSRLHHALASLRNDPRARSYFGKDEVGQT